MTDYKNMLKNDNEYMSIVNEYKAAKADMEKKAKQGIYNSDYLRKIGTDIHAELTNKIKAYHNKRINELSSEMDKLKERDNKVGYADRPNDAKEFEMRYKLASDKELKDMVQDLNTDDILEINLLRMELKNRGMDESEKLVKRYVIQQDIGGMDDIERREYEYKGKQLATLRTLGNNRVVIDDGILSLDSIGQELWNIAKQADKKVAQ
jgi:hypothetical protein